VDTSNQRLDSVHINSNMKNIGRLWPILSDNQKGFLKTSKKKRSYIFATINTGISEKYSKVDKTGYNVFSQVPPDKRRETLESLVKDLFSYPFTDFANPHAFDFGARQK
jgi:hypothetical protein